MGTIVNSALERSIKFCAGSLNRFKINLKDGFDIDLADISDQWSSKNGGIPDQHNLVGAKFSTFDKVKRRLYKIF